MFDRPDSLDRYLAVLFARARPSTLAEVRWRVPHGMGQRFLPAGELQDVADVIRQRADATDVYIGVLPRWRRRGGRAAVAGDVRTAWVDLDEPDGENRLAAFAPAPHLVVRSGGPGHVHAYWFLRRAVTPAVVERINRRLAWALGGDLSSADAARILRPPQTINHGRDGVRVEFATCGEHAPVGVRALVGDLPDPPAGDTARGSGTGPRPRHRDDVLAVEPDRYVELLTGQRVGRNRKVRCPLHDDSTPSLHVYRDPERGWFCFGCRRGGSVYDLAAAVWHIEPYGSGFAAIREGLRHALGQRPKTR